MSLDDDRLVDGKRLSDVLREDEEQREREQAAAHEAAFNTWMSGAFDVEPAAASPPVGTDRPAADPDPDPDLDAFVRSHFPE